MKKFADALRRQDGFTVIELIAALAVFSLVAGLISTVTIFGLRQYDRVMLENSLREEGDVIMSSIMTELYTFAPDTIVNLEGNTGILLRKGEGDTAGARRIEIADGALVIREEEDNGADTANPYEVDADLSGSLIQAQTPDGRTCRLSAPCTSGLIGIQLKLDSEDQGTGSGLELESKFGF